MPVIIFACLISSVIPNEYSEYTKISKTINVFGFHRDLSQHNPHEPDSRVSLLGTVSRSRTSFNLGIYDEILPPMITCLASIHF